MSEPVIRVQLNVLDGLRNIDGTLEECPECGCTKPLLVVMTSGDWSTTPMPVSCPWGHAWPASELEAWQFELLLAEARQTTPQLGDLIRELAELRRDEEL